MKNSQKKNNILPLAVAVCLLSLGLMVFALRREAPPVMGEFVPPPFEPNAVAGAPQAPQGYSVLDCKAYQVGLLGKLGAQGEVWFANPEGNTALLKLRVLDERGNILGETGLLRPGEYVRTVELVRDLRPGTAVTLKIMGYEPETYFSAGAATLNTTVS